MSSIARNQQREEYFVQILAQIQLKEHKQFLLLYGFPKKSSKNMSWSETESTLEKLLYFLQQ